MQSFLTKQLSVLNQKVDDFLCLSSITHHCALKGVPLSAVGHVQCANSAAHLIRATSKSSQSKD